MRTSALLAVTLALWAYGAAPTPIPGGDAPARAPERVLTQPPREHDTLPFGVALSPDGERLFVAFGTRLEVWPTRGSGLPRTIAVDGFGPFNAVHLTATADGRTLVLSVGSTVHLIDEARERVVRTFHVDYRQVMAVATTPDAKRVAVAGTVGQVAVFDVASGKRLFEVLGADPEFFFGQLAFSPDGTRLAAGGNYLGVHLWALPDGAPLAVPSRKERNRWGGALAWLAGGTLVVDGRDAFVSFAPGALVPSAAPITMPHAKRLVAPLARAGGPLVIEAASGGGVRLVMADASEVEVIAPNPMRENAHPSFLAVAPDGTRAVVCWSKTELVLYDTRSLR